MALMTLPYPEVAVFANWHNENLLFNNRYGLDPRTELILAVGIATYPSYIKNRPDIKTLGFTRSEQTFRNPNTGSILDFYAATPEELNREYFIPRRQIPYDSNKVSWMSFPSCCGLSFLSQPLTVKPVDISQITNKLGIIAVQPNNSIEVIKHLLEVLGFVPAYYLKESTVFYKHLTSESLA